MLAARSALPAKKRAIERSASRERVSVNCFMRLSSLYLLNVVLVVTSVKGKAREKASERAVAPG